METQREEGEVDERVDKRGPSGPTGGGSEAADAGRHVPPPEVPGRETPGDERSGRPWPEPPHVAPGPAPPALGGAGAGAAAGSVDRRLAVPPASTRPNGGRAQRAATPGQPLYLPRASWRWPHAVAGLFVGAAPQLLLALAAAVGGGGSASRDAATAGSAALLAVSALVLYGWQGLAAWLFSLRTAGRSFALWGFRRPTRAFFWTVPLGLAAVYAASAVHEIIVRPQPQQIVTEFPRSGAGAALFVLVAVVMAPLFEEVVFRGFLFRGFANSWGWVWGALASGVVFGFAHLQLDVFVPLATLGFVLAWAYKQTGSIWTCITMHVLFNAIAVLAWALTG